MLNFITIQIFCSHLLFKWLQDHLLPCPFKYLTGIDCPGCGFQRSVIALFHGDLHKSMQFYPAAIPLIIFFAYGFADRFFNLDSKNHLVKKTGYVLIGAIVLVSYGIKMYSLYIDHRLTT